MGPECSLAKVLCSAAENRIAFDSLYLVIVKGWNSLGLLLLRTSKYHLHYEVRGETVRRNFHLLTWGV